jgi:host factor-I protein
MTHNNSLQDSFLDVLREQNIQVSIFLVNGIKLHGVVDGFDQQVVMLKSAVTQMIYKQAISTIVPSCVINVPTHEK